MADHRDVMEELAIQEGWKRGVELGLGSGKLFARFLGLGIEMIGVDLGLRPDRKAQVKKLGGRVLWMDTSKAAHHVQDGWADFIFIDAAHSYKAVEKDILLWQPKVRLGGWLGGHDFHPKFPGVERAVREIFGEKFSLLPGYIWVRS